MRRVVQVVKLPVDDYLAALQVALPHFSLRLLLSIVIAAGGSWWLYVPFHELAHAFGCIWTGGEVSRLDIDPLYGAAMLQQVFPFINVGSAYAGQLSGFNTHGNDLIYLVTDAAPFLLSILVGIPLLRAVPSRRTAMRAALCLGVALPIAYAPFVALTGDYYEMGSIVVSRLAAPGVAATRLTRWRSDDVMKLASQLFSADGGGTWRDALGISAAFLLGTAGSFATYWLGARWSDVIARRARRRQRSRPLDPSHGITQRS